ncbi:MAG: carotenoid biosynthesis protein [Chloroflexi bacterium]|nr:carotenoid biosynthesis protein [Chloroflexota bacterium]MBP8057048.1 carotenoid biosynthesis protein [Chloroflexota bacterium]
MMNFPRLVLWSGRQPVTLALLLVGLWLLCMIFVPIANWVWGAAALRSLIVLSVVLQAGAVLAVVGAAWGWRYTLTVAFIVAIITFGVEYVGSHTGWPFGDYTYTELLRPQIGNVPLLIPLAWLMMLPCAWAIAQPWRGRPWLFALISGLALTAWDLFLDPQMAHWQLWVWQEPGGYFGIPWQNYWGWLLTGTLLTWFIRPRSVPTRPLLLIYSLTWFLETFGLAFFWGLTGPALVGGLVMGGIMVVGWRKRLTIDD